MLRTFGLQQHTSTITQLQTMMELITGWNVLVEQLMKPQKKNTTTTQQQVTANVDTLRLKMKTRFQ